MVRELDATTLGASVEAADLETALYADDCSTVLAFAGSFGDQQTSLHHGDGNTYIPTSTAGYRIQVSTIGTPTNSYAGHLQALETTLTSPYWQVLTAAGYDAAPQIANGDEVTRSAVATFYDGGVTAVCQTTRTIGGNGLSTFGVSGACGLTSGYGSARIAHSGPPGAITGNITTFSGASGLSFDAPFFPLQAYTSASDMR